METRGFSGGKWVELPPDNERPIAEGGAYEVEAHRGRVGLTLRDSTYECAFVWLTPDEARTVAAQLIAIADEVDPPIDVNSLYADYLGRR